MTALKIVKIKRYLRKVMSMNAWKWNAPPAAAAMANPLLIHKPAPCRVQS